MNLKVGLVYIKFILPQKINRGAMEQNKICV